MGRWFYIFDHCCDYKELDLVQIWKQQSIHRWLFEINNGGEKKTIESSFTLRDKYKSSAFGRLLASREQPIASLRSFEYWTSESIAYWPGRLVTWSRDVRVSWLRWKTLCGREPWVNGGWSFLLSCTVDRRISAGKCCFELFIGQFYVSCKM